ncbi:MAG: hypothetical protein JSS10_05740 [Verrucomicrobia bacterium]|nr:hypothetical protein [Verrucomicrobiota bacterium]
MTSQIVALATNFQTIFSSYTTAPIEFSIDRVYQLVQENTSMPKTLGKAAGSLVALGVAAATAAFANRAWNKKCSSKKDQIASRSFALLMTAASCYVTWGVATASNADRNLLSIAAASLVLFHALRPTPNRVHLGFEMNGIKYQTEVTTDAGAVLYNVPRQQGGFNRVNFAVEIGKGQRYRTELPTDNKTSAELAAAKKAFLQTRETIAKTLKLDPQRMKHVLLKKAEKERQARIKEEEAYQQVRAQREEKDRRIALRRKEEKETKAKDRKALEAELLKWERYEELESTKARVHTASKRLEDQIAKRDALVASLENERQALLNFYAHFYSDQQTRNNKKLQRLRAPMAPTTTASKRSEGNPQKISPISVIRNHQQNLVYLECQMKDAQRFIEEHLSSLQRYINSAMAYHREIGGTSEDIAETWNLQKKSANKLEEIAHQIPVDAEEIEKFSHFTDAWDLLIENEIKITTHLQQHSMLRRQELLASHEVAKLEKVPEVQVLSTITDRKIAVYQMRGSEDPILVELQRVVPDVETKTNPRHLFEIHLDLTQWQEMKKQKQELLQKSQAAYEKLIERAKRTHEELQAASQELERYTHAHRSKQMQLPIS